MAKPCSVKVNMLAECEPGIANDSVREVAQRSSMSEKIIRSYIRNDALPHWRNSKSRKIWLRWADFVAWMERRRIELRHDDGLLGILRDLNGARTSRS
jgi:antibiotic biosynthesis monooxygenase (ABM) superfamily enzyme